MRFEEIRYDVAERIATITLNRPERLNAWTHVMAQEVKAAMRRADDDSEVRVILLTGEGRGFCAGADIGRLSSATEGDRRILAPEEPFDPAARADFQTRYSYFPAVPKPVIAAVNGPCAGIGFVLALYCDMRFAAPEAMFTTAFSRRGLIAEHGVNWTLPALVGHSRALDAGHQAPSLGGALPVTARNRRDRRARDAGEFRERGLSRGRPPLRREAQAAVHRALTALPLPRGRGRG